MRYGILAGVLLASCVLLVLCGVGLWLLLGGQLLALSGLDVAAPEIDRLRDAAPPVPPFSLEGWLASYAGPDKDEEVGAGGRVLTYRAERVRAVFLQRGNEWRLASFVKLDQDAWMTSEEAEGRLKARKK
jgi:hypothetical protein